VAPNDSAYSSFRGFTSTATIADAPAMRAAWIAQMPTAPAPSTTTELPGSTRATFTTDP
jgi:hypothetical protein